ncbi:MAG: MaoC family dehydratase N-terminal domain-containing protein [Chloroflexi bacterium]|nr:MaoC family dehydratase N-terminal domain-containing protein [Chloroflexota bacterium]
MTEADIVNFAGLSGDYTTIHTDAEYAKSTPFGERIAHGMLGLSAATGLTAQLGFIEGTVIAFTGLDWKFKGPIKIGDTIHVSAQVKQTKAMRAAGGGMVVFDVRVINQRGETVQQGEWSMLVKSKG